MSSAVQPDSGIEQLLRAENELLPPKSLVENARVKDYAAEYKRSVEDPEDSGPAPRVNWNGSSHGPKSSNGNIRHLSGSRAANATSRITRSTVR